MHKTRFIVRGSGEFPYDMLRYDACWPEHELGERSSRQLSGGWDRGPREVTLLTERHVTPRRWESFGWKVVTEMPAEVDERTYDPLTTRQGPRGPVPAFGGPDQPDQVHPT